MCVAGTAAIHPPFVLVCAHAPPSVEEQVAHAPHCCLLCILIRAQRHASIDAATPSMISGVAGTRIAVAYGGHCHERQPHGVPDKKVIRLFEFVAIDDPCLCLWKKTVGMLFEVARTPSASQGASRPLHPAKGPSKIQGPWLARALVRKMTSRPAPNSNQPNHGH